MKLANEDERYTQLVKERKQKKHQTTIDTLSVEKTNSSYLVDEEQSEFALKQLDEMKERSLRNVIYTGRRNLTVRGRRLGIIS